MIPYGTVSAVALDLTDVIDKLVVDDWGQAGVGPLGACAPTWNRPAVRGNAARRNRPDRCGPEPGRERDDETILFWHRGLSFTDIALGQTLLAKAREHGSGTRLPYRR